MHLKTLKKPSKTYIFLCLYCNDTAFLILYRSVLKILTVTSSSINVMYYWHCTETLCAVTSSTVRPYTYIFRTFIHRANLNFLMFVTRVLWLFDFLFSQGVLIHFWGETHVQIRVFDRISPWFSLSWSFVKFSTTVWLSNLPS